MQPRKTNTEGGQHGKRTKHGSEQLHRLSVSVLQLPGRKTGGRAYLSWNRRSQLSLRSRSELRVRQWLHEWQLGIRRKRWHLSCHSWFKGVSPAELTGGSAITAVTPLEISCLSMRLTRWQHGAGRCDWRVALRVKRVAVGPRAGSRSISDPWRVRQLSAAVRAQRICRRLSALRVKGLALTKKQRWRLDQRLKTIVCWISTTWETRADTVVSFGLEHVRLQRRSEGFQGPKGIGWHGVAGGPAVAGKAVRLIDRHPNVDAHSWLRGYRPSGASTSSSAATMANGALPSRVEEGEREEGARPAQTTRPPRWGSKHGGKVQEHTGITCLSIDRSLRPRQARSAQAGPSSQHQGSVQRYASPSGIVRMDPMSVPATLFADLRGHRGHMDTNSSGGKSRPRCRGGRGGSAAPAQRSRAALRGRRVRMEVRHHCWCLAGVVEHLFLHGGTTARGVVSGCRRPRALERGELCNARALLPYP